MDVSKFPTNGYTRKGSSHSGLCMAILSQLQVNALFAEMDTQGKRHACNQCVEVSFGVHVSMKIKTSIKL